MDLDQVPLLRWNKPVELKKYNDSRGVGQDTSYCSATLAYAVKYMLYKVCKFIANALVCDLDQRTPHAPVHVDFKTYLHSISVACTNIFTCTREFDRESRGHKKLIHSVQKTILFLDAEVIIESKPVS